MISGLLAGILLQVTALAPMDYPGFDANLAQYLPTICAIPMPSERGPLQKLEQKLATTVQYARNKATAAEWGAVACARAMLSAIDAPARGSFLMYAGTSWKNGARDAARRAIAIDPSSHPGIDVIAVLAVGELDRKPDDDLAVLRVAVEAGVHTPEVLRACTELAFRTEDHDLMARCTREALSLGLDSTWHQLRLARQRFRDADTLGGTAAFLAAARSARGRVARMDLDWHLQWFLSPTERGVWQNLPDSGRGAWAEDRLRERDLRDGRPPGTRLAEHFARLEFVEDNFRLRVPDVMRQAARTGAATFLGFRVGQGFLAAADSGALPVVLDSTGAITSELAWREYRRWQINFDDRGVVWMRFGKPDQIAMNTPLQGQAGYVTWKYMVDGQPMLVHFREVDFDGSSGATDMAVGVVAGWQCGMDVARCLASQGYSIATAEQFRQQDREYLAIATTRDDNSPRGRKTIRAVGLVYQLWDVATGAPLSIYAYGVRVSDLMITPDATGNARAAVAIAFRRWHPATAEWREDSLPSLLDIPEGHGGDTHATAFRILPAEGGIASWGMTVVQDSTRWGRAYGNTTPLSTDSVALSDLIAAPESRGISWVHRGDRIYLSPGGIVTKQEPLRLYYQVRSQGELGGASTQIAMSPIVRGVVDSVPATTLGFTSPLHAGVNVSNRTLDLSQLPAGKYQLEVRVTSREGVVLAWRGAVIDVE